MPLQARAPDAAPRGARAPLPARFWVYAGFAVLYGVCETLNGNWAQLDLTGELGASQTTAAFALTAFWAMVTVGRVLFAAVQRRLPARVTYHFLPFLLAGAFVLIALLPDDEPVLGVLAFGLAGLGCSALLPLTISFGEKELASVSAAVAGGVIAFYQLGYGIAAFGVGPLVDGGVELATIYACAALVAAAMGGWSFVVARHSGPRLPPTGRVISPSGSRSRSSTATSGPSSWRSAAACAPTRAGGRELLDGYGADEMCRSGRGQMLIPWPNRLQDGAYEFDGRRHQLPLNEPEQQNAIHGLVALVRLDGARARAESRRDGAHDSSPARLPVLARSQHRVRALRPGPVRRNDGHERRPGPVPVRVRRASVPDPRNRDRRLGRS